MIQVEEMKAFLAQVVGSSSKGPSSLTCCRTDRNTQLYTAKAFAVKFADKSARQEASHQNNNAQVFVLGNGVRHGPSKKSIEGSFVSKYKSEKK